MHRWILAGSIAMALSGCNERPIVEVPATHPASPLAEEAPPAPPSTTLALPAPGDPQPGGDVPHLQLDPPVMPLPPASSAPASSAPSARSADQASGNQRDGAPPASAPSPAGAQTVWTCPMHPQIAEPAPGRCPICSMQLAPRKSEGATP
jgi:hypothetical protein